MRDSKAKFLERCSDIKCQLQVSSYTIYDYEDGCYADFKVSILKDPRSTLITCGGLIAHILSEDGKVILRVYEDFREY